MSYKAEIRSSIKREFLHELSANDLKILFFKLKYFYRNTYYQTKPDEITVILEIENKDHYSSTLNSSKFWAKIPKKKPLFKPSKAYESI